MIEYEVLKSELEKKQDVMLNMKASLFQKTEGEDGDTGVCSHRGKFYFAMKLNNEWRFAELKQAKDL